MKHALAHRASWLAASLLAIFAISTAHAKMNILVACHWALGEPDQRYHRCEHHVLKAALPTFITQLREKGFYVYDESVALGLAGCMTQGQHCSHGGAQLIEIAKSTAEDIEKPIDVVVAFSIFGDGFSGGKITLVQAQGRLWNVHSSQSLGSFKAEGGSGAAASENRIECGKKSVRECAELLARDVANQIAKDQGVQPAKKKPEAVASSASIAPNCDCEIGSRQYTLEFHNFTYKEIDEIEQHLANICCFSGDSNDRRPTDRLANYVRYSYYSPISVANLSARLAKMLDMMEAMGFETNLEMSGNTFTATKK